MNKTRILAIAPYEGLKEALMEAALAREDEITMDIRVGDLEKGLSLARETDLNEYDIVLSRGGTAELLESSLSLPVISIDPTVLDILRSVRVARNMACRYAIAAFPAIADIASKMFALIDQEESIYVIHNISEAAATVDRLKTEDVGLIIGDAIVVSLARERNMNAALITSGLESVHSAINAGIRMHTVLTRAQEQFFSLRYSFDPFKTYSVLKTKSGKTVFTDIPDAFPGREALFRLADQKLSSLIANGGFRHSITLNNESWYMIGKRVPSENGELYAFTIERKIALPQSRKSAFRAVRLADRIGDRAYDHIGQMHAIRDQAEKLGAKGVPVLLIGEPGTPVDEILQTLLSNDARGDDTLFCLDCAKADESTVAKLLESESSPLTENNIAFCFENIAAVSERTRRLYIDFVTATKLHNRDRIFYVNPTDPGKEWNQFFCANNCMTLALPPLRERSEDIPPLATLYIAEWNVLTGKQILGLTDDAIGLLLAQSWPCNNESLRKVIHQAVLIANGDWITASDLRPCLGNNGDSSGAVANHYALTGTLEEIIRDVAQRVLKEENGSHVRAAKRLGISRTTLWRILRE